MTGRPTLAVIQLSESFRTAWTDLSQELGLECVQLDLGDAPARGVMAVVLSAGGEEDRALDVLPSIRRPDAVPLYVVGAQPSHRFAVEAVRRGATDFFALPGDLDLVRRTLTHQAGLARETVSIGPPERRVDAFSELLGHSASLETTLDLARRVVHHGDVTVLIQGETGTGKELLARALHDGSARAAGAFVAVNCAAIPAQLMESELFGHERGAFTDAHATSPGLFEEADGGTLFLDEIGHLPIHLQGKLLRALDDKRIRRLGATQNRTVDVRIIAASLVDLSAAARRGEFREDLFYRLNVVTLTLPPLRERGDDVMHLARAFADSLSARYGLPTPAVTPAVQDVLRAHGWPGNVRELRHAVERALLLSQPGTLDPRHLIPHAGEHSRESGDVIPFPARLNEILAAVARATIARHGGNKSAAARTLDISRARLSRLSGDQEEDA